MTVRTLIIQGSSSSAGKSMGWQGQAASQSPRFEESLEKLADAVENSLDMKKLEKIIWES